MVKMTSFGIILHDMYVFRHEESEFEVHFETKIELMVFLRMRSNKITKNAEKYP